MAQQGEWFYSVGGAQAGPVDLSQLKALAAGGQLQPTDLVWRDGLADWKPASTIPDLFGRVPAHAPAAAGAPMGHAPAATPRQMPSGVLPYSGGGGVGIDAGVSPRVVQLLSATRPWVLLVSILTFIGTGIVALAGVFMLFAGVLGAASGSRGGGALGAVGVVVGLMILGLSLLTFFPGLYLARYASRIGALRAGGRLDDLEGALEAQKSYWKFIGILALIYIGFYVVAMLLGGLTRLV